MTTIREFDSKVAKAEGLKHQASIGDVRELRRIIFTMLRDMIWDEGQQSMISFLHRGARGRKGGK